MKKLSSIALFTLLAFFSLKGNSHTGNYDPVSYFQISSSQNPKKGLKKYSYHWQNHNWYFSSAKNLALFKKNPGKYAPAYQGNCAYAISNNYLYSSDPLAWSIKDGRLFLNYNKSVRSDWLSDAKNHIKKGDKNWPHLK